ADDLAALDRLHEALLGGPAAPTARRHGRGDASARALVRAALVVVAAVVVAAVAAGAAITAVRSGAGPEVGRSDLAHRLQERSGLDSVSAVCAARRLAEEPDVLDRPEHRDDVLAAVAA